MYPLNECGERSKTSKMLRSIEPKPRLIVWFLINI